MSLFTNEQKLQVFKQYNSLKTHEQQYLYLQKLVVKSENQPKVRQKFDYYFEVNEIGNDVYFKTINILFHKKIVNKI